MTKTYTIPMASLEKVMKEVARIQKKAERYGFSLVVEYGEPYAAERGIYMHDEFAVAHKVDTEMVEVLDVTINSDVIKKGDYQVIAYLEHGDAGNVVSTFTDLYRPEWSKIPGSCEHCGRKHRRSYTYIVKGADGEHQVGRSCLKDYCGIDPHGIGSGNQLDDYFLDEERWDTEFRAAHPVYDTINVLAHAIEIVKEQGYVRSDEPHSNRLGLLNSASEPVSAEQYEGAKTLADGILGMDEQSSLIHNVKVMIQSGYCNSRGFGYIAYAPVAYTKWCEKKARDAEREATKIEEVKASNYIGSVGERMVVDIAKMDLLSRWENDFGFTYLYKMVTTDGNILIWYASSPSETLTHAKVTVKAYNDRDGVRQTVVNRCKAC